ncbi:hypothetical protein TNCV_228961 [Trichonephila clavipes]|nr:hypothetical protein TNCV_228961 [Trichonephila clavipes]
MFIVDLIVPMYAENYDSRLTMTESYLLILTCRNTAIDRGLSKGLNIIEDSSKLQICGDHNPIVFLDEFE